MVQFMNGKYISLMLFLFISMIMPSCANNQSAPNSDDSSVSSSEVSDSGYKPAVKVDDTIYWLSPYSEDKKIVEIPSDFEECGQITAVKNSPLDIDLANNEATNSIGEQAIGYPIYSSSGNDTIIFVLNIYTNVYLKFIAEN